MWLFRFNSHGRRHLLIHQDAAWAEVSPLPGLSQETVEEAEEQLRALQQGWKGPLLPSVAFGIASLQHPILEPFSYPAALLFKGSVADIYNQAAEGSQFTHAKLKVGNLKFEEALDLVHQLKTKFRLRVDVNQAWTEDQTRSFCSHFSQDDLEFLEDPLKNPPPLSLKIASDFPGADMRVWKPTVWGVPQTSSIVLSSAYETGVGIAHIAFLAKRLRSPHPIGVGTYRFLPQDVLKEALVLSQGHLHVPRLDIDFKHLEQVF